jgi:REP element-mobilizing transposase RayT
MNISGNHIPSRRPLRLKGYDYSKSGFYFLTLCVQHRLNLFGKFIETHLVLNDAGKMVERWYFEMENKYPAIRCHEMIVMPNHFHCIVEILPYFNSTGKNVMDAGIDTTDPDAHAAATDAHVGAPLRGRPNVTANSDNTHTVYGPDNKKYNATIGAMMDWFKTMTTNEYIRGVKNHNWQRFDAKLWQRNYWEHIIRNEDELARIANYIVTNPANWINDRLNSDIYSAGDSKSPAE